MHHVSFLNSFTNGINIFTITKTSFIKIRNTEYNFHDFRRAPRYLTLYAIIAVLVVAEIFILVFFCIQTRLHCYSALQYTNIEKQTNVV
jgi:hypothetical protein